MIQFFGPIVPECSGQTLSTMTGERMCTLCDLILLIDNVVKLLTAAAPILVVIFIIWGAYLVMTAGGSPDRVRQGWKTITTAVIGMVIVLAAWVIVSATFLILTGSYQGPLPLPWYRVQCG